MSLTTTNLAKTVKKQYFFKLKANIDSFSSMVGIQLLALLFSLGGVGSSGMGGMDFSVNTKHYSSDLVLVFTAIWSFVTAITITTKPYRNHDFSFVSNRLSSSLANVLFLLTTSILGAFTTMLSGNLLQILGYLFPDEQLYFNNGTSHFFLGLLVVFFYLILASSIGYLIGAIVQVNKIFIIVIPVLIIGMLFQGTETGYPLLVRVFQYYLLEPSLFLFLIKTVLTSTLLWVLSLSILNRLEVRR